MIKQYNRDLLLNIWLRRVRCLLNQPRAQHGTGAGADPDRSAPTFTTITPISVVLAKVHGKENYDTTHVNGSFHRMEIALPQSKRLPFPMINPAVSRYTSCFPPLNKLAYLYARDSFFPVYPVVSTTMNKMLHRFFSDDYHRPDQLPEKAREKPGEIDLMCKSIFVRGCCVVLKWKRRRWCRLQKVSMKNR